MNEKKLINTVFCFGGVIFGGYVRDLLAGEKPNDMDVRFISEQAMHKFVFAMARKFSLMVENRDGMGYSHIRIKADNLPVEYVDCTWGSALLYNGSAATPDCDVNMLLMSSANIIGCVAASHPGFDYIEAIINACNKRFKALPGASPERIEKMLAKGWAKV